MGVRRRSIDHEDGVAVLVDGGGRGSGWGSGRVRTGGLAVARVAVDAAVVVAAEGAQHKQQQQTACQPPDQRRHVVRVTLVIPVTVVAAAAPGGGTGSGRRVADGEPCMYTDTTTSTSYDVSANPAE